jgi:hypothetical protein
VIIIIALLCMSELLRLRHKVDVPVGSKHPTSVLGVVRDISSVIAQMTEEMSMTENVWRGGRGGAQSK